MIKAGYFARKMLFIDILNFIFNKVDGTFEALSGRKGLNTVV